MATTTEAAIRTQMATLVVAIAPLVNADAKFREHRYDQDFVEWAEANRGSLRAFSVRDTLGGFTPETTNISEEWREATFELLVAYPKTFRYGNGEAGARNRDEVMRSDMHQLETAVGLRGFTAYTAAVILVDQSRTDVATGDGVDFLRLTLTYGFYRSMP